MKDNILYKLLKVAPTGWALIRAVEYELLLKQNFKSPVLDIGCGDGVFTKVLLKGMKRNTFDVGLDSSDSEIEKVKETRCYKKVVLASASNVPFKDGYFSTILSNGTLEHIPGLNDVLVEISRVLKKGGKLVFTAPSVYFTKFLIFGKFPLYGKFFNCVFKHYNLFNHKKWSKILSKNNLKMIEYYYYNPKKQIKLHDFLTICSLPCFINKLLFKRWIIFPKYRQVFAKFAAEVLKKFYNNRISKKSGGSLMIVAQKI